MTDIIELTFQQLAEVQMRQVKALAAEEEAKASETSFQGIFLGRDGQTGLGKVRLVDGSLIEGQIITNKDIKTGDKVFYSRGLGQLIGTVDALN